MTKKILKFLFIIFILLYLVLNLIWYFFYPIHYITKYDIINNNNNDVIIIGITYNNIKEEHTITKWEKYEIESEIKFWDNPSSHGFKSFDILSDNKVLFNSSDYLSKKNKFLDNVYIKESTDIKKIISYFPFYNKKEFIYFYKKITVN